MFEIVVYRLLWNIKHIIKRWLSHNTTMHLNILIYIFAWNQSIIHISLTHLPATNHREYETVTICHIRSDLQQKSITYKSSTLDVTFSTETLPAISKWSPEPTRNVIASINTSLPSQFKTVMRERSKHSCSFYLHYPFGETIGTPYAELNNNKSELFCFDTCFYFKWYIARQLNNTTFQQYWCWNLNPLSEKNLRKRNYSAFTIIFAFRFTNNTLKIQNNINLFLFLLRVVGNTTDEFMLSSTVGLLLALFPTSNYQTNLYKKKKN